MPTEKKPRSIRTPKSAEAITKGALALELADRVKLRDELTQSIDEEVDDLKLRATEAEKIANGSKG